MKNIVQEAYEAIANYETIELLFLHDYYDNIKKAILIEDESDLKLDEMLNHEILWGVGETSIEPDNIYVVIHKQRALNGYKCLKGNGCSRELNENERRVIKEFENAMRTIGVDV